MPQRPDRLLDLALRGSIVVISACAVVLVATFAVELLYEAKPWPAIWVQQAAARMPTVMQLYLIGGVLAAAWLRLPPNPNEMPVPTWVAILAELILPLLLLVAVVMWFVTEEPEP